MSYHYGKRPPPIYPLGLAVLAVGILISVYAAYSLFEKNKNLEQKNFELTHSLELVDESLQEMECSVGRRGIFYCAPPGGWKRCFDSFEDSNPGDKSKECCKAMTGGEWHDGKCCAPDRDNAGWIGKTGECTKEGNWAIRR